MFGKGKQVRDNIHSADVVDAFLHFWQAPHRRPGKLGGGREQLLDAEAIGICERIAGRTLSWT